ncbi:MAG: type III-D CRISPR-associated protein Csx19 [Pseudonocardiaceae bacterium]
MTDPHHATVTLLTEPDARDLVDAVVTGAALPEQHLPGPTAWLYAAARDGLITGYHCPSDDTWVRSTDVTADGVGTLAADTLHTVRIFGEHGETLLRATPEGRWRGRALTDSRPWPVDDLTAPLDRTLLLAAGRAESVGGDFHRVTTRGGRTHVVPRAWTGEGLCLVVRDYLASHPDTGQLRVACSRCVRFDRTDQKGT